MYSFFFCRATAASEIDTLSLHDALPIFVYQPNSKAPYMTVTKSRDGDEDDFAVSSAQSSSSPSRLFVTVMRSEEHTSELQSRRDLVCRLLLEKKKKRQQAP